MRPDRVFLPKAGGIGDLMLWMLERGSPCGYLKSLKENYPDVQIKVLTFCHNAQARTLFEGNPWIDHVECKPFDPLWGSEHIDQYQVYVDDDGVVWHKFHHHEWPGLHWSQPSFFLSDEESKLVERYRETPYIAFHPFAGSDDRTLESRVSVAATIDAIAARGKRVVIVGLKDRSVALDAVLTSRAEKFIGTLSCFNCVAAVSRVPTLAFAFPEVRGWLENDHHGIYMLMRNNRARVLFWDEMPDDLYAKIGEWAVS